MRRLGHESWEETFRFRGETYRAVCKSESAAREWKSAKLKELNKEKTKETRRPSSAVTLQASILDYALAYTGKNINIFPVHSLGLDGRCTCGDSACQRPAKHPKTAHGLKDATTDEKQIRQSFGGQRRVNIGVATGADSGVFTLDIDGWIGNWSFTALECDHGKLPLSWEHETGRGFQIHFQYPNGLDIRNSTGKLGRGLDIRGRGGYSIWPPSRHYSGRTYRWTYPPEETALAPAPDWLVQKIVEPAKPSTPAQIGTTGQSTNLAQVLNGAPHHQRDDLIYRYACRCVAKGMTEDEITTLVLQAARNSSPPFPEKEALAKVTSAFATHHRNSPGKPTGDDIELARETVRSLITMPKEIHTRAFEPSTVSALALVRKEDPAEWVNFKKNAPGIVKDIERAIRKASLHAVSHDDSTAAQTIGTILNNLGVQPPSDSGNLILPDRYIFDSEGLGKLSVAKEGQPVREGIAPDYVLITGRLEDVTTKDWFLTVSHLTQAGWQKLTASRGDFVDAARLVRTADKGVPVWSGSSKALAGYFFHF